MQIELSIIQRRIVLQGLWKELDMYNDMLKNTTDVGVTKHVIDNINAIMQLEDKLLGVTKK
jgi:hypothetical protein